MNKPAKQALFYSNVQGLSKNSHATAGLKLKKNFRFTEDVHMVPIVLQELSAAAVSYPIIFAGEEKNPIAALGLTPGENLFVDNDGNWPQEYYIPSAIRRYPFLLASGPNDDKKFLCIDEDADTYCPENPELPFFDGEEPSDLAKQAMQECEQFEQNMSYTAKALTSLEKFELFCVKTLSYTDLEDSNEKKIQFTALDDKRFNDLNIDELADLKRSGLLDLAYAHFISLSNWNRLIYKHNSQYRTED